MYRAFSPPVLATLKDGKKACRRGIKRRLADFAVEQAFGQDVEIDSAAIAAHCTNCGKCTKMIAGLQFMLSPRRSTRRPGAL